MPHERKTLAEVNADCWEFQRRQQTLILGTRSDRGEPAVSYAPYVGDERGNYYIFVSELAAHTAQLLAAPTCSLLFIEDESACANLFARQRLTLKAKAELVTDSDPDYQPILTAMEGRFGQTVSLLRSLPDFLLFRLTPCGGRYICGFGKAYHIHFPERRLEAIGPPVSVDSQT